MHELGIMNKVLELALKTAEKNNGTRVTEINLVVGVMSGILPYYAEQFFTMISRETIAEGARLVIEQESARFICLDCGSETVYDSYGADFLCQNCGSKALRLVSGRSFQVSSVAIV